MLTTMNGVVGASGIGIGGTSSSAASSIASQAAGSLDRSIYFAQMLIRD
jgi:hypothetical protein